MEISNYTTPNWAPIERRFNNRVDVISNYMWMYDAHGVSAYKHKDTRRYIYLNPDGSSGRMSS